MRSTRALLWAGAVAAIAITATPTPAQFPGTPEDKFIRAGVAPNTPRRIALRRNHLHNADEALNRRLEHVANHMARDGFSRDLVESLNAAMREERTVRECLEGAAHDQDDLAAIIGYTLWSYRQKRAEANIPDEALKGDENPAEAKAMLQEEGRIAAREAGLRLQMVQLEQNQRIIELLEQVVKRLPDAAGRRTSGASRR